MTSERLAAILKQPVILYGPTKCWIVPEPLAALITSTYGKGTTVTSVELADRITAALDSAHGALDTLDRGTQTGAIADQAALNTLRKVVQDLGALAADARKAASDEAAKAADEKAKAAAQGPAKP